MNGIKFIVNQMAGNMPDIQRGPTTEHRLMHDRTEPRVRPQAPSQRARKVMRVSDHELRRMFKTGVPYDAMQARSGLSRSTIVERLGDAYQPRRNPRIPDSVVKRAAAMRSQGVKWTDISQHLGVRVSTISQAVKVRGFL